VGRYPFQLRLAAQADLTAIHYLISEASAWLRTTKNTDQWKKPWPSRSARDARVRAGVENRATWIAWDGGSPVGTITIAARPDPLVWSRLSSECRLSENAVYAHRLVIARKYAGLELGAELIDWVGLYGVRRYGARWVRVDVWRSNAALHDYYQARGFAPCGECADPRYPSGALFQKSAAAITEPGFPRFADTVCTSAARSDGFETCQLAIRLGCSFPADVRLRVYWSICPDQSRVPGSPTMAVLAWLQSASNRKGAMAKRHGRPSVHYRYGHYDFRI
jgi:hypothetical protein